MSISTPQVSIIMATFNRAHLIEETLNSIINQSYVNWECLIIDDESVDNTKEILQPYLLQDPRFIYNKRSKDYKKGLPGCRNMGLKLAKGDYIIFFDDDDIVHPENLKICTDILSDQDLNFCRYDKEPFRGELKPVFTNQNIDFGQKQVTLKDIEDIVIGNLAFASCIVMWKKRCFSTIRFNEDLLYAEEWECYTRILSTGIEGVSIDKILYYNRKHPNSNTGEFHNFDLLRRSSNLMAIHLVIDNLSNKRLLSPILLQYFIRTGFLLKEISVINAILKCSNASTFKKLKYRWGFKIYPVLKPFFNLKAKLKKS